MTLSVVESLPPAKERIARHTYWASMRNMWIVYVAVSAAGIIMSIFITEKSLSEHHEEMKTGLQNLERRKAVDKDIE